MKLRTTIGSIALTERQVHSHLVFTLYQEADPPRSYVYILYNTCTSPSVAISQILLSERLPGYRDSLPTKATMIDAYLVAILECTRHSVDRLLKI